jgi:drug/metabolite transporter (DMT)-like permease
MIEVIFRECIVLLLGVAVSLVASLFGNAGRDFAALVAAVLIPIAFCLLRAATVRYPSKTLSVSRRTGFQLAIGLAFASLLVFEMGVAMFAGAADIPLVVWVVVGVFGICYVLLFAVAHLLRVGLDSVATS